MKMVMPICYACINAPENKNFIKSGKPICSKYPKEIPHDIFFKANDCGLFKKGKK